MMPSGNISETGLWENGLCNGDRGLYDRNLRKANPISLKGYLFCRVIFGFGIYLNGLISNGDCRKDKIWVSEIWVSIKGTNILTDLKERLESGL